jgi:ubiquinone/menaquinone biosynthesis C-methylase UbiE
MGGVEESMPFLRARRAADVEIMDAGGYDEREMKGNLADLRFFNAWFGGSRMIERGVARLIGAGAGAGHGRRVTLLDVATGSGDIPAYVAASMAARGIEVTAEGIDANADVLREARGYQAGHRGAVRLLRADARRLPHADGAFDVTVCSNFLHHLGEAEAVDALKEMARVSRIGVVAADLTRGGLPRASVWLLTRLTTTNRLTRNDGPLSVDRAFTPAELSSLAREAGMDRAEVRRAGPVRMVLTWRR